MRERGWDACRFPCGGWHGVGGGSAGARRAAASSASSSAGRGMLQFAGVTRHPGAAVPSRGGDEPHAGRRRGAPRGPRASARDDGRQDRRSRRSWGGRGRARSGRRRGHLDGAAHHRGGGAAVASRRRSEGPARRMPTRSLRGSTRNRPTSRASSASGVEAVEVRAGDDADGGGGVGRGGKGAGPGAAPGPPTGSASPGRSARPSWPPRPATRSVPRPPSTSGNVEAAAHRHVAHATAREPPRLGRSPSSRGAPSSPATTVPGAPVERDRAEHLDRPPASRRSRRRRWRARAARARAARPAGRPRACARGARRPAP